MRIGEEIWRELNIDTFCFIKDLFHSRSFTFLNDLLFIILNLRIHRTTEELINIFDEALFVWGPDTLNKSGFYKKVRIHCIVTKNVFCMAEEEFTCARERDFTVKHLCIFRHMYMIMIEVQSFYCAIKNYTTSKTMQMPHNKCFSSSFWTYSGCLITVYYIWIIFLFYSRHAWCEIK